MNSINALRAQMVQETRAQRDAHLARMPHQARDAALGAVRAIQRDPLARKDGAQAPRGAQEEPTERAAGGTHAEKLAQEYQKKLMNERLIKQMEEEETQLIERLRISHEMQRAAYEHLEFVIQHDDGQS
ncbi:hypothetical protein PINS_up018461 [Pythium insidiosum]|nr:hypothetical protein PINS_up018461 [Pythium insidiosum]